MPGRPAPPDSKLVIYVGHDTNLANIGGMLNVNWRLKSYLPNDSPPAGAMAFELLRETASDQYFVRMAYYSQTPDQMRNVSPLSATQPPDRADILPACGKPKDGACPWSEFAARAVNALDMDCVVATPR